MSKKEWGNITWILFHTLACKIKDDSPVNIVNNVFSNIIFICNNLPCPYCRDHASSYLKKYKDIKINKKEQLILFLFDFHNKVNNKLRKKIEIKEILDKYTKVNLNIVLSTFKQIYNKKQTTKMMLSSFHINLALKNFFIFMSNNKKYFIDL